jgi:hypothetical protein
MKMLPNSQATFWQETELPQTCSQEAFHAKTLALQGVKLALEKEREAGFMRMSLDWLAKYDLITLSWKMSAPCFLDQMETPAHGSPQSYPTWPQSGMMRSGTIYPLRPWAVLIAANVSGLLPTPNARDGKDLSRTTAFLAARSRHSPSLSTEALMAGVAWQNVAHLYEMAMGFPAQWTDAE